MNFLVVIVGFLALAFVLVPLTTILVLGLLTREATPRRPPEATGIEVRRVELHPGNGAAQT